jgi:hypothetical protein
MSKNTSKVEALKRKPLTTEHAVKKKIFVRGKEPMNFTYDKMAIPNDIVALVQDYGGLMFDYKRNDRPKDCLQ